MLPIKTVVWRTYFTLIALITNISNILIFSKSRRLLTRCKQSLNRSRKSRSFQLYLLLNEASISARLRKRHVAVIYLENAIFLSLCQKKKENWSINVAISWPINHDFSLQKASKTHSLCFFPFFFAQLYKNCCICLHLHNALCLCHNLAWKMEWFLSYYFKARYSLLTEMNCHFFLENLSNVKHTTSASSLFHFAMPRPWEKFVEKQKECLRLHNHDFNIWMSSCAYQKLVARSIYTASLKL